MHELTHAYMDACVYVGATRYTLYTDEITVLQESLHYKFMV
jgi:hypothetical protein